MNGSKGIGLGLGLAVPLVVALMAPARGETTLGTAFTYQGQLKKDGAPLNGACDFQFSLWDAATGGSQVGTTQTVTGRPVTNGLFTVQLDFGQDAFNGDARWLEIAVKGPGEAGHTKLSPRQPLTPAPYALALPGLRTQQNPTSPNPIGGYSGNHVSDGVHGATIGGGGESAWPNRVTHDFGAIGGGSGNVAGADHATVSGGRGNGASQTGATVAGGSYNTAHGWWSAIPGGKFNEAAGSYSFAAGRCAKALHGGAFVWADGTGADYASSADNQFCLRATGGIRIDVDTGGSGLRILPHAISPNLIAGYSGNSVAPGVKGATIAGGGVSDRVNLVEADFGTIGGGYYNRASFEGATVAGGCVNRASGDCAAIPGGAVNSASGDYSFAVGLSSAASGDYSFAAGRRARAIHQGSFVWADSTDAECKSWRENQFYIRADGGAAFDLNDGHWVNMRNTGIRLIDTSTGAHLWIGGIWTNDSDVHGKDHVAPVDPHEVLKRLANLPISTWNYEEEGDAIRHMGPMAQDFHAAFGLGADDKSIGTLDADGVALAAIQGLHQIVEEKDAEIADLKARLAKLEALVATLASTRTREE